MDTLCQRKNLKSNNVCLKSMPDLENCFDINIHVYSFSTNEAVIAKYKSLESITNAQNKQELSQDVTNAPEFFVHCLLHFTNMVFDVFCD